MVTKTSMAATSTVVAMLVLIPVLVLAPNHLANLFHLLRRQRLAWLIRILLPTEWKPAGNRFRVLRTKSMSCTISHQTSRLPLSATATPVASDSALNLPPRHRVEEVTACHANLSHKQFIKPVRAQPFFSEPSSSDFTSAESLAKCET